MTEETSLIQLDIRNPYFFRNYTIIQGINYLSEKIGKVREEKINFFFYIMSIIFGALTGSFWQAGDYLASFILLNCLLLIIILHILEKNKIEKNIRNAYLKMEKQAIKHKLIIKTKE